jgi:O-antigen/teichoic acid export membrane protein
VVSVLAVLRGIVFARVLGPSSYGVWGLVAAMQGLSAFADGGVSQVAVREMPRAFGSGDVLSARRYAALSIAASAVTSAVGGVVLAGAWRLTAWPSPAGRWLLFPALFVGMNVFMVSGQVARGFFSFRRASVVNSAAGAVGLAGGYLAASRWGVSGLLSSQALVYAGAAALMLHGMGLAEGYRRLDRRSATRAFRSGWSLLLPGLALQFFVSLDILMTGWLLGATSAGLYAVALLASNMAAGVLSSSTASVIGQYVLRESGGEDRRLPHDALVWGPAAALAAVLAPACAAAALIGPLLLRILLPRYTAAIPPMIILLVAAYYLHSQFGFSTTLVAAGRQLRSVPLFGGLAAANILIDVVLVRAGLGILGIAIGTLCVNVAFALAHMLVIAVSTRPVPPRALGQMTIVMLGGLGPVAAATASARIFAGVAVGWWLPVVLAGAGAAMWVLLVLLSRSWAKEIGASSEGEGESLRRTPA